MPPNITRQILGQKVEIGDLYNACKDVIIDDSNLFDSQWPENLIDEKDKVKKTFTTTRSDFKRDRYAALSVSAETGASVAVGLSKPAGASQFLLSSSSPSSQTQQAAAICAMQAKIETLDTNSEELKEAVNLQTLGNTDNSATHVVVGVTRGARLTVLLQNSGAGDAKDISTDLDRLASEIGRCFNTKSPGDDDEEEEQNAVPDGELVALSSKYEVKARSDFTLKAFKTTTYEGICKFAAQFPTAIDKATAALSVQLMPIKDFLGLVQGEEELSFKTAPYKEVDQKVLAQILEISDKIGVEKKAFADFMTSFTAHKQHLPKDQLDKFAQDKAADKLDDRFRFEVGEALAKARSSSKGASTLTNMLADYAAEGKKDPSKINDGLKPWATKISFLSEAEEAGIPVSTLAALTAGPKSATNGVNGANGTSKSALLTGDIYAFYLSAAATLKGFEKAKAKAYELLSKDKTRVVIVDLDTDEGAATFKGVAPCIQMRRDGKAVVPDIVADEEELEKMCLIRCKPTSSPPSSGDVSVVLEKRLPVIMACPHPACSKAGAASSSWMCPTCKEQVTFGCIETEDHYRMYCNCGSYDSASAEFRCNSKDTHGSAFASITPAEGETAEAASVRFRSQLCQMKPFEQYNILIMGATGAGKSTFINAFVNYLLYDTLEDALDAEQLTYAIPGSFSVPHPTIANKKVEVSWGAENATEAYSSGGQSATQSCVIYAININGKLLRLVDTPGLGDTRGIDQDYKNVADIMRILESLTTISSILFVVKNNESRLTTSFDFVLSELMMHLHKDTIKNIMFGFSYGRTSIPPFSVGTVGAPLMDLLKRKKLPMQQLITDQNAFVFDAEGFLNVAAWQQEKLRLEKSMAVVSDSWRISAEKARLMINVTMSLPMHDTKDTLRLERNRRLVNGMANTMTDMSSAMTDTLKKLNARLAEIKTLEADGKTLGEEHMQFELISLVEEKLPYPRTVCRAEGCASNELDPNTRMMMTVFNKSCHIPCSISTPEAMFGVRELGQCLCFDSEGADCKECHHSFMSHCHISYRQVFKKEIITRIDEAVVQKKTKHKEAKSEVEWQTAQLESAKAQLKWEQDKVTSTMARFSIYLGANSVTAYNDGVVEHLNYLMENAKKQGHTDLYRAYDGQRALHVALIEKRKEMIEAKLETVPTNEDIEQMLADLKDMEMYGRSFKDLLNRQDARVPYQPAIPIKVSKTGSWDRLGRWLGKKSLW
ncbi:hypothetical protein MKX08_001510 [Trichoderma sp. CBMAI-0020]|nr:hypothetical protein MKX08_001510 [Trichoderma sp. CBMAI-0020]